MQPRPAHTQTTISGFTLIELSIVLVIIGLIVGGVLVGKDLIGAAEIRSQISQIEKYQTAVNTFRLKFGYIPGDIPDPAAQSYGFAARGGLGGGGSVMGNGDGYIWGSGCYGWNMGGETLAFWADLSKASLIDGTFNALPTATYNATTPATIALYMPQAKIGQGNFVGVWSTIASTLPVGKNYFSVSVVTKTNGGSGWIAANPGLSVQQAYNIDAKVDDGMPQSGKVLALYSGIGGLLWAAGGGVNGAGSAGNGVPTTAATGYLSTNCYDNDPLGTGTGTANTPQSYSLYKNASAINCTAAFQFQ